jgi:hypothetical protein
VERPGCIGEAFSLGGLFSPLNASQRNQRRNGRRAYIQLPPVVATDGGAGVEMPSVKVAGAELLARVPGNLLLFSSNSGPVILIGSPVQGAPVSARDDTAYGSATTAATGAGSPAGQVRGPRTPSSSGTRRGGESRFG